MEENSTCLWCQLNSATSAITFIKKAHTIPQALGGKFICADICDTCNHYFGSPGYQKVAIEVVLREAFELTRNMVFSNPERKCNYYARFKSVFFKLNTTNKTFSFKQLYSIKPGFQAMIAEQFKRGLFKIFLEEYHRQVGEGMDERYNFIREYARYGLGDYPIFYLVPKLPVLFYSEDEFIAPRLNFSQPQLHHIKDYEFYLFNLFGHGFLIPTHRNWHLNYPAYIRKAQNDLKDMYRGIKLIKEFKDVDFACNFLAFEGSHWDV